MRHSDKNADQLEELGNTLAADAMDRIATHVTSERVAQALCTVVAGRLLASVYSLYAQADGQDRARERFSASLMGVLAVLTERTGERPKLWVAWDDEFLHGSLRVPQVGTKCYHPECDVEAMAEREQDGVVWAVCYKHMDKVDGAEDSKGSST